MRRAVYWSAGALFCLTCAPHIAPAVARRGYELSDISAPEELTSHVRSIAAAMGLPHSERVRVFISKGFSSLSAGTTLLPGGAVIGLPRTMLFREEADVRRAGLTLEGEAMDWDSEEGKKVSHVLLPSAQQINFSIAHEVAHLQHLDFLYHVLLVPSFLVVGYMAAKTAPKYAFPRYAVAAFPFIMGLTLLAYAQTSASISRWQEHRADSTAARSRHSYCRGGIETMQKRLFLDSMFRPRPTGSAITASASASFATHPPFSERQERLEKLLVLWEEGRGRPV